MLNDFNDVCPDGYCERHKREHPEAELEAAKGTTYAAFVQRRTWDIELGDDWGRQFDQPAAVPEPKPEALTPEALRQPKPKRQRRPAKRCGCSGVRRKN